MSETLWVTRGELAELSGFRLPLASVPEAERARFSQAALDRRLTVPGLSYEQIRTLERQGLFDLFHHVQAGTEVRVLWRHPKRARGETAQYSLLDVGTARLYAWLLHAGFSHAVIRKTLLGDGCVRALLMFALRRIPDSILVMSLGCGALMEPAAVRETELEYPDVKHQLFPIRWLGLSTSVLPRVQKMRQKEPEVWRHGRYRSEAPASAEAVM